MSKKAFSAIMLALLLTSVSTLAFTIQPVMAIGTIYIRTDGSINPPTAPIQRNRDTYTLTASIYTEETGGDGVVIQRSNIVLEGAGYKIQGPYRDGSGINLLYVQNVTVRNVMVKGYVTGVDLLHCRNVNVTGNTVSENTNGIVGRFSDSNMIAENNITSNTVEGVCLNYSSNDNVVDNYMIGNKNGLRLRNTSLSIAHGNTMINNTQYAISLDSSSSHNEIRENTIQQSYYGMLISRLCPDNTIFHNNLINNTDQANSMSSNMWDNGCEGNYWSNYNGSDLNSDGVGDTYLPWEGVDNYPLMNVYWDACDINHDLKVDVKDLAVAAKAFDAEPDHLHADITGSEYLVPDGKVDIRDMALIVKHFGFNLANVATQQTKINGLTIALDTLRSTDTPQTIVNFMKRYNYNALRIYMGWCSSLWTGNVNAPMNTRTQTYIDELCRLCAQNKYTVVCAVSMQVTPFATAFPNEIQVGPNGEQNSQGNWVCPSGPNFQAFTRNLVKILVNIMEKHATPRISVDEMVFVTCGDKPTFYSQSMRSLYQQRTGKSIPIFSSTYGSYDTEKSRFIEFAKSTIRDFYLEMKAVAKAENPSTIYQALIDTYWVYPRTSYDTEPWDFYGSSNLDEITYEWFYAIRDQNWVGITDGLRRVKNLNPTANKYFIYGTSEMTTIANMRQAVGLVMAQDYDGVFLYEYAKSRSHPLDVSDIVLSG